jgi:Protein of unknown function (DUF1161)
MKVHRIVGIAPLIVAAIPIAALARDCNEVKAEIDAKIKAKGVMNYALRIVNGNCDAGAKKIVYFKEPSSENASKPHSSSANQAQPLSPAPATPIITGSNPSEPVIK